MKKFLLLALFFSVQSLSAQAARFIYQVSMKLDSTQRGDIKTETAILDVSPVKSVFYAEKRIQRDSVFARARQTGGSGFDRSQMENLRSNMDYIVEKDFTNGTKTFTGRIARNQYSYIEDRPLEWTILPETATIGAYKTQKAETQFAGRTWYAWFANEIPFQDGPYKFSGLPGLIVKVEDSKGDYSFDLKETRKVDEIQNVSSQGNVLKISREGYEKQLENYRKDPVAAMQAGRAPGRGGARNQDPNQRRQVESRLKDEIQKNNNPIELK
jgi:GLPGLI family protein